jgi:hypothetical protein
MGCFPAWSARWGKGWNSRTQGELSCIKQMSLDMAAKCEFARWKLGQIIVAAHETFSKFLRLYL